MSAEGPQVYTNGGEARRFAPLGDGLIDWLRQDDDVRAGTCVYKLDESAGRHTIDVEVSETVLVLSGRIRFEIADGPALELGPGEAISFERGTSGEWSLAEDTELFFVAT
ncbi:MAG: DUF861 domain-containing protein [Actinobacteria bacterium]|nr:DUF861 domain-containing protein [Actinomycetota bacterium]